MKKNKEETRRDNQPIKKEIKIMGMASEKLSQNLIDFFKEKDLVLHAEKNIIQLDDMLAICNEDDAEEKMMIHFRPIFKIRQEKSYLESKLADYEKHKRIVVKNHLFFEDADTLFSSLIARQELGMGRLNFLLGNLEKAFENFSTTSRLDPAIIEAELLLACVENELDHYEKAIAHLNKIIEREPQNLSLFFIRSFLQLKLEKIDAALADLSHIIDADPSLNDPYYERGKIYFFLKNFDKALSDFKQASKAKLNFWEDYPYKAVIYYFQDTQGDPFTNEEHDRADLIDAGSCNVRALIAIHKKQYEKALCILEGIPSLYRRNGMMLCNLANLQAITGDLKHAIENYNKMSSFFPHCSYVYHNRGYVKLAMANLKGAIDDYTKALELDPTNKKIITHLETAKKTQANKSLQHNKIKKLDPTEFIMLERYPR